MSDYKSVEEPDNKKEMSIEDSICMKRSSKEANVSSLKSKSAVALI